MINEIKIEANICGKKQPKLMTWKSGDYYTKIYVICKCDIAGRNKSLLFTVNLPGKAAEAFIAQNLWEVGKKVFVEGHMGYWQTKQGEEWGEKQWEIACTFLGFRGFKGVLAPAPTKAATVPASAKPATTAPPPEKAPEPAPKADQQEMANDAQEPEDDELAPDTDGDLPAF